MKTEPLEFTLQAGNIEELEKKIMDKQAELTKLGIENIVGKLSKSEISSKYEVKGDKYTCTGKTVDETMKEFKTNLPGIFADKEKKCTFEAVLTYTLDKKDWKKYKKEQKPPPAGMEYSTFSTSDYSIF